MTPLHDAMIFVQPSAIELLLKHGAFLDYHIKDFLQTQTQTQYTMTCTNSLHLSSGISTF